jgi:hypothetical protein
MTYEKGYTMLTFALMAFALEISTITIMALRHIVQKTMTNL